MILLQGILEWVMETNSKGNKEIQEKIIELQKEKDHLTLEYRDKRKKVDELKEDLQRKIAEYSKLAQSGGWFWLLFLCKYKHRIL